MTTKYVLGPAENRDAEEPLALEPRELFDPCILGMAQRFTSYFLVYDQGCVIKAIQDDAGTDYDTALEHFLFNVVGGWVGEGTPAFQLPLEEVDELG